MNNSKLWLVVKPTVGVPLFLSAVAIGSFAVHVAVLSNTSWVSDFLSGVPMGTGDKVAALQSDMKTAPAAYTATGGQQVLVVLPDGRTVTAVMQDPQVAASFSPPKVVEQ
jgi:light-harvesting protein B-800-850 alpha chain